jgi:hypothetical protein
MHARTRITFFPLPLLTLAALASAAPQSTQRSGVVTAGKPTALPRSAIGVDFASSNVNTTLNESPQNETWIAVDPNNPLNLVGGSNDYRFGDAQAGVACSFNGGGTWTSTTLDALDTTLGKYDAQGDPAIAALRNGVFYYAFIDFNRNDGRNRLAVARSNDGGLTWPQLGVIIDHSGSGSLDFEDKEQIAVDDTGGTFDGNVYVAWTRYPAAGPERVMASRSTNGGVGFTAPVQISDSVGGYQGTALAVDRAGKVYVAWNHSGRIEIDVSTNGGLSFGVDRFVANVADISSIPGAFFRVNSFPAIAIDRSGGPFDGNVYIVWADQVAGGFGEDIVLSRSTDGGLSWSVPVRVSKDISNAKQFFPAIAVTGSGQVLVSFFDNRLSVGTTRYDVFAARSTNGGASFGDNRRITDETSDSLFDGFGGGFIGDYSGLAAAGTLVFPYWTDTRPSNANAEAYVRRIALAARLGG